MATLLDSGKFKNYFRGFEFLTPDGNVGFPCFLKLAGQLLEADRTVSAGESGDH